VANAARAREVLGWTPRYPELRTIVEHAWRWHTRGTR
jgi:UDP-glucose 4-epimerase